MRPKVEAINALEKDIQKLSDAALQAKTAEFKQKLDAAPRSTTSSSPPSPCAARPRARAQHAALRRAAHRRHGPAPRLHRRDAHRRGQDPRRDPARYLNALEGKGVHIVTVNDYLATRDAEWMGRSTTSSA
jgi:preprotein translocase subunit SecA